MPSRRLILVQIIHTEQDLGALAATAREATRRAYGESAWDRKQQAAAVFWTRLNAWAATLASELSDLDLYQDGLPVCGRERTIVEDLALRGSPNHRLLLDLVGRGATLVGTESPELLLEEYELARRVLAAGALAHSSGELARKSGSILARRDEFIARRIDATLKTGRTGLLFIGALHDVKARLPASITVELAPPASFSPPAHLVSCTRTV